MIPFFSLLGALCNYCIHLGIWFRNHPPLLEDVSSIAAHLLTHLLYTINPVKSKHNGRYGWNRVGFLNIVPLTWLLRSWLVRGPSVLFLNNWLSLQPMLLLGSHTWGYYKKTALITRARYTTTRNSSSALDLQLFKLASSWGAPESKITPPPCTNNFSP